jgi:hypothetical protein
MRRPLNHLTVRLGLIALVLVLLAQVLRYPHSDFWRGTLAGAVIGVCLLVAFAARRKLQRPAR